MRHFSLLQRYYSFQILKIKNTLSTSEPKKCREFKSSHFQTKFTASFIIIVY